jgi:hypothetical protein
MNMKRLEELGRLCGRLERTADPRVLSGSCPTGSQLEPIEEAVSLEVLRYIKKVSFGLRRVEGPEPVEDNDPCLS